MTALEDPIPLYLPAALREWRLRRRVAGIRERAGRQPPTEPGHTFTTQTHRVISITSATPAHLIGFFDRPDREPDAIHALDWTDEDSWPYPHTDHPDQDAPEPDRIDEAEPGDDAPAPHLYHLLAKHGPTSFTTSVNARMPRGDELNDLGTEPGIPLLQITRTMTDPHGRPLEYAMIEAASDRIEALSADTTSRTPGAILTL